MALIPRILLPRHSQADFRTLRNERPNRVCFATVHSNALKDNSGTFADRYPFKFSLPFKQGVLREFHSQTGISLRESQYGYWAPLSAEQAEVVRAWVLAQGTRVYLKDLFDCSIALEERTVDGLETETGRLFTAAKHERNDEAIAELIRRVIATIRMMRSFEGVGGISCPTPRAGKDFDLPTAVAERVARRIGVPFVNLGIWDGPKGQLKEIPADQKWAELDKVGFSVNASLSNVRGDILVIDDIYQSGTTLNFLRSRLTNSGVARASSLSLVKAARDTDNQ